MEKGKKDYNKTWMGFLVFVTVLFFIVGLVMVTVDTRYLQGTQYLISAILFSFALYKIKSGKINIQESRPFIVGFIFTVIGLSINIGVWALGIVLFTTGLKVEK